jgi:hypothetical protein
MIEVAGLPEGIVAVRYGVAEPGEFFMQGTSPRQQPAIGFQHNTGLIVEPADGLVFVYELVTDQWIVAKKKHMRISAEFLLANERDIERLREGLRRAPGYVDHIEQSA